MVSHIAKHHNVHFVMQHFVAFYKKVAVNGTHQCESMILCGAFSPNLCGRGFDLQENGSGMRSTPAGQFAHSQLPAQGLKPSCYF
jgi:hypothetical protein